MFKKCKIVEGNRSVVPEHSAATFLKDRNSIITTTTTTTTTTVVSLLFIYVRAQQPNDEL
jgi:hypothetical protein